MASPAQFAGHKVASPAVRAWLRATCRGLRGAALQSASAIASGDVMTWNADGYLVTVDTQWSEPGGYCPVQISIAPLKPPADDVRISLEFSTKTFNYWYAGTGGVTVEQDVTIPKGATQATSAILSVPLAVPMQGYSLRFWEDGELLDKLSGLAADHRFNTLLSVGQSPDQFVNALVFKDSPSAAARTTMGASGAMQVVNVGAGQELLTHTMPTQTAPERWLDYTALDVVCATPRQLRLLAQKHPRRWQALRDWVLSGGNLWIYGVDRSWNGLPELERLLALPPSAAPDAGDDPLQRGWRKDTNINLALRRALGLGEVVVAANPGPPVRNSSRWSQVFGDTEPQRLLWNQRNGLSTTRENRDFWNLLIPGVGRVPLLEFQALITIFVLGIGPVNYFLLRRRRKLHLLIVTVPGIALLVTLLLLGYAVLADGLGVRVRRAPTLKSTKGLAKPCAGRGSPTTRVWRRRRASPFQAMWPCCRWSRMSARTRTPRGEPWPGTTTNNNSRRAGCRRERGRSSSRSACGAPSSNWPLTNRPRPNRRWSPIASAPPCGGYCCATVKAGSRFCEIWRLAPPRGSSQATRR